MVIDLGGCTYLDSTFLGGLVSLLKRHGEQRFAIYAPADKRRILFSVSRLDQLLPFVADPPPTRAEQDLSLEVAPYASREELGQYIVDCHRRLAELGGDEAQDFPRVADALENELRDARPNDASVRVADRQLDAQGGAAGVAPCRSWQVGGAEAVRRAQVEHVEHVGRPG